MRGFSVATEEEDTFSSVSNSFIDYYMTDANGDYVKIYLYLLRVYQSGRRIRISDIADHFNLAEKDIARAIKYWVSKDVLGLTYTKNKTISSLLIKKLTPPIQQEFSEYDLMSFMEGEADDVESTDDVNNIVKNDIVKNDIDLSDIEAEGAEREKEMTADEGADPETENAESEADGSVNVPKKAPFSAELLDSKNRDENFQELIAQAEAYYGNTLSQREMSSLIYVYDNFDFSFDLMEYLLEYVAERKYSHTKGLEKIAISWFADGIKTREEAKQSVAKYKNLYRNIYKNLGIANRSVPTPSEADYIKKWVRVYCFSDDIILEACKRANISKPNGATFSYVDGILKSWSNNKVKTFSDIQKVDNKKPVSKANTGSNTVSFANYTKQKSDNDFDEIAKLIQGE